MTFNGFTQGALARLADLPGFDKAQYDTISAELAAGLRAPAQELAVALADTLDPGLTVERRRSVSPLHRDLRFAPPGASRYKDHLLVTMWQGEDKSSAPTLWVRLDTSSVGFASGVAFTPAIRDRWRAAVGSDDGAELDEAIGTVLREHAAGDPEVAGEQLKTVPKPWAADHPRADLLRLSGFQLRFAEPTPACITEPEFVPWCEARLRDLLPIHRWLVEHVSSEALTE